MKTITLTIKNGMYHATFSDPKVIDLFGTNTIITPFSASMSREQVVTEISKRNPDCEVICS